MRVMGTHVVVLTLDAAARHAATTEALGQIESIEDACSRFRPESDLSKVNASAGETVDVGPCFIAALDVALDAARRTDGLVDPTVGQALRILGYDRDFGGVERSGPAVLRFGRIPGWQAVEVDRAAGTVRIPRGTSLDLGATAKALAADEAAHAASVVIDGPVLVSIGGDIAVAGGAPEGGWCVRVTDAHDGPPEGPGETVRIDAGGLATSSVTVRHWNRGTTEHHHIVDPATGRSAEIEWRTVSVAAGDCVDANVASTAAIVLGPGAAAWLDRIGLPARLVRHDGMVATAGGWGRRAA